MDWGSIVTVSGRSLVACVNILFLNKPTFTVIHVVFESSLKGSSDQSPDFRKMERDNLRCLGAALAKHFRYPSPKPTKIPSHTIPSLPGPAYHPVKHMDLGKLSVLCTPVSYRGRVKAEFLISRAASFFKELF